MRLYHPVLDRTIERSPSQARTLQRSGWVDADTHNLDKQDEDHVGGDAPEDTPDTEE